MVFLCKGTESRAYEQQELRTFFSEPIKAFYGSPVATEHRLTADTFVGISRVRAISTVILEFPWGTKETLHCLMEWEFGQRIVTRAFMSFCFCVPGKVSVPTVMS